jgi:hypothetical protein
MNDLFDLAVNDLGINRVRLQIHSGAENPTDYGQMFINGQITEREWLHVPGYDYQTINDNEDPFVINPAGFQFSWLDRQFEAFVLPMKMRAEAKGEALYINLCIVDFNRDNILHSQNPEEYAEFVLAIFQHLNDKYGIIPDGLEIQLEPPNGPWNPISLANALVAAGKRLEQNGFTPEITAPSHMQVHGSVEWFDQMVQIPEVTDYLTELSYHRYGPTTIDEVKQIGDRGKMYQIKTAHLEKIGANYEELYQDLTIANVSSWAQYTLGGRKDDGGAYFLIDEQDVNNVKVSYATNARYLRQYFKFVRKGAVRIQADSTNPEFGPVAFINSDGKYVVVIKTDSAGKIDINGLPPGVYGVMYTTENEFGVEANDIQLNAGEVLSTNIKARGVITIYSREGGSFTPLPTATIAMPTPTATFPVPTIPPTETLVEPTIQEPTPLIPTATHTPVATNTPEQNSNETEQSRSRPGCSGNIPPDG